MTEIIFTIYVGSYGYEYDNSVVIVVVIIMLKKTITPNLT